MTEEKAMEILSKAFASVFYGIISGLEQKKVDVEQEILMSQDIEEIRSLVDKLNTIDKALGDIGNREDHVATFISDRDRWYDRSLLCELAYAFRWLPKEDEAE